MPDTPSAADRAAESTFVQHEPCPDCGSKDNLARYTDGHGYCFGCGRYEAGDGTVNMNREQPQTVNKDFVSGEFSALTKRGISEETCRKFGYAIGHYSGQPVQIAPFHNEKGQVVAQHIRFPNKDFIWIGDVKHAGLWGQHLWRDSGKMVVVTEGEIDAMTISQLQGNKWPVVSIRNGAQGAKRDIGGAVEWLEKFERVIFAFDMDDPGKKAAVECALLLSPGKAHIWNIPLKDANEMLQDGREKQIIDAVWGAKVYRPDGIVSAEDTWELLVANDDNATVRWPWAGVDEKTAGLRLGEIVTFCAGSGIGKSQVCRELAMHLVRCGEKVGYIALEENIKRSIRGLVAIEVNAPIHIPRVRETVSMDTMRAAWERIKSNVFFYDHWGSTDSGNILHRIRYLARGCGCRWIVLDHLSIIVSGDDEGNERRKIDNLMTALRSLVEELSIGLLLVSHLKRPEGKSHEEGGRTTLAQLRGSGAIGQLSDIVIGQERDMQDEETANQTLLRVLKNRFTGETGPACTLEWNRETGRLAEMVSAVNPFVPEEGSNCNGATGRNDPPSQSANPGF